MFNFWEQLGLNVFQTILAQLHFDPARQSLLRNVLVPIRDTLLVLYPINPPAAAPAAVAK